jgi:hypothetical protein
MPGAQCTRSLVCAWWWYAHEYSKQVHPKIIRHPHAMVLTVSFALSTVTNSSCHRRRRICLVQARSGRRNSADLTLAKATA